MAVDPADPAHDAGFDVVRRGYDQGQVDMHLRRIDAEISILAADRNAAVDQAAQLARELDDARARAEKLRAQVRTLAGPPQSVQGMSERMRSMLRLAEDEVADMLGRAETDAAKRRQEAELEAAQTLASARAEAASFLGPAQEEATELAERTVRERAQLATDRLAMERAVAADRAAMEQEIAELRAATEAALAEERATVEQVLAAQRADVEREVVELSRRSEEERNRLWAESESHRAEVEQDFTIAMDQRRTEALAALHAERAATRREIDGLYRDHSERVRAETEQATAHARRIIADAERRVAELVGLRGRVAEQLTGTQAVLGRVLGSLAPLDDETAATAPAVEPPTVQLHAGTLTGVEPVDAPAPATAPAPEPAAGEQPNGAPTPGPAPSPTPRRRNRPRATASGRR